MVEKPTQPIQPAVRSDLPQRLKMVEERLDNLRTRVQVIDQNLLEHKKKQSTDNKIAHSEIEDLKKELDDMKSKLKIMINEIKMAAKDEDLQIIKKYLEYFEPINFVTRKEVSDVVKEAAQRLGKIKMPELDTGSIKKSVMRELEEELVKKEEIDEIVEDGIRKAFEKMQLKEKILQYIKDHVKEVLGKEK